MVVKGIPLHKLHVETDSPYCDIRPTHFSWKYLLCNSPSKNIFFLPSKKYQEGKLLKGRNEPCNVVQVAEVIANIKGISIEEVKKETVNNTKKLFFSQHC